MRVLVIGGTGFIGPYVVRRLIEEANDVAIFHRGETEFELPETVEHVHGDRRELGDFSAEFKVVSPDVVLDMFPYTEANAKLVMSVFKGVAQRVVAISSADVYRAFGRLLRLESGVPDPVPLDEEAPLREMLYPYRARAKGPDEIKYHYEKILVERVVMNDAKLAGTVLRLPAVYGPTDQQHRLFGYLKRMDDKRTAILLQESLAQWRWTRGYVENVADAIAVAVTDERAANRIYNVGPVETPTEADWVRTIGKVAEWDGEVISLPNNLLPEHLAATSDFDHHIVTDTTRIRVELGYDERIPLEEALRRTIEWERPNPAPDFYSAKSEYAAEDAALDQYRLRQRAGASQADPQPES